jgi:hypothetical protein
MKLITALTADATQQIVLIGELKENIKFTLYYKPSQQSWFFDIDDGTFILRGVQLGLSYNVLRNYKNLLTYGIGCASTDGQDPYYINDFVSGRVRLFLLNSTDKEFIEGQVYEAGS